MIGEHRGQASVSDLCAALEVPRASFYRFGRSRPERRPCVRHSARRIPDAQRAEIVNVLNSESFRDMAPPEIHAVLLDSGAYLCSERTMYRLLQQCAQNVQRRQRPAGNLVRPELLATAPNQIWSWDITKLKGPVKWTYFFLYVIMDIFSRYVVGWLVSPQESGPLAEALIGECCLQQEIVPGTLTIHADNGSSMTSKCVSELLADLGVTRTHSRPHVSNDNPYSESGFKTLKYRPDFPVRFGSEQHASEHCEGFFTWYNTQHRHSGIAMFTPREVHFGTWRKTFTERQATLAQAHRDHPERFVNGLPRIQEVPAAVWINKPNVKEHHEKTTLIADQKLSQTY